MQKIDVKVSGGIDINVNLGIPARQDDGQSYFSPEFIETLRQYGKFLQQDNRKGNVLSDPEGNGDFEFPPVNGVLFDTDTIVMVVNPECSASAMTVEDSRAVLDIFEGDEVVLPFPLLNLKMSCKPDSIVTVEDRSYLVSTAVVFSEEEGYAESLDSEDLHLIRRIMDMQCETIIGGGKRVKALRL